MCVCFDRYGKLKGTWGLGGTIMDNPPYDGFSCIAQLRNGDLYTCSFYAMYLVGAANPDTGNGHTYRHFVLRPPASFSQPVLRLSTTNVDFHQPVVNQISTATLRLSNPGSAPLALYSLTMSGDTNAFAVAPLRTLTLEPGYGSLNDTNVSEDCVISFAPVKLGPYHAQLAIPSLDFRAKHSPNTHLA